MTFTEKEIKRIESVFRRFSDHITVLRDPNEDDLEDYFTEIANLKANKLKMSVDGKAGCALLFHYVGHGAIVGPVSCMILNQEFVPNHNPYPIEMKLRAFAQTPNSFVLGSLNCCRVQF